MRGNVLKKIGRAFKDIVRRPDRFSTYVKSQSTTPLDMGLPWISFDAIEFLDKYLTKDMTVFEYGSGGSSVFFSPRVKSVTSVEDNSLWLEKVKSEAAKRSLGNITLIPSNWDSTDESMAAFEASDYLTRLQDSYDIILIDGMCFWPEASMRELCFERAKSHLNPGGIIIVDDSWRYDEALENSGYSERKVLKSLGPCRPGVTSTTVYWF